MIPAHPRCRCIYAGVVELDGEDIPVDGPEADAALEAAQADAKKEKALHKAAESATMGTENNEPPANAQAAASGISTKAGGDVKTIGTITNAAVAKHWGEIKTDVVLTDERIAHICEGHAEDYVLLGQHIKATIETPTYILEDSKNSNTAMFVKHIAETNMNVVVRLALRDNAAEVLSSVITMYRLGEKTLKRLMKKNPAIYNSKES